MPSNVRNIVKIIKHIFNRKFLIFSFNKLSLQMHIFCRLNFLFLLKITHPYTFPKWTRKVLSLVLGRGGLWAMITCPQRKKFNLQVSFCRITKINFRSRAAVVLAISAVVFSDLTFSRQDSADLVPQDMRVLC